MRHKLSVIAENAAAGMVCQYGKPGILKLLPVRAIPCATGGNARPRASAAAMACHHIADTADHPAAALPVADLPEGVQPLPDFFRRHGFEPAR